MYVCMHVPIYFRLHVCVFVRMYNDDDDDDDECDVTMTMMRIMDTLLKYFKVRG